MGLNFGRNDVNSKMTGSSKLYLGLVWMVCCGFLAEVNCTFNLYMDKDEVKRILGLTKELYYVREGVPNTYALNFVVPISSEITVLRFTWESLGQKPLPYTASVISSDNVALQKPTLSVPTNGTIPSESQTFEIYLACTGFKSTELIIEFSLNVTAHPKFRANDVTTILLRRKKICLEGQPDPPGGLRPSPTLTVGHHGGVSPGGHSHVHSSPRKNGGNNNINVGGHVQGGKKLVGNNNLNEDIKSMEEVVMINEKFGTLDPSIIYIILGCSFGLFAILLAILAAAYIRTRKGGNSSSGFLTVETSGKGSKGSGSACGSSSGTTGTGSGSGSLLVRSESPHHYSSVSPCLGSGSYTYSSFQRNTLVNPNPHYAEISRSTLDSNSGKLANMTVERCKVRLESVIMEGTFAKLYKGTVQEADGEEAKVIVKTVIDQSSPVQMALLLHEGLTLVGLGHKHVYSVIGVAAEERVPPFLIYADDGFRNLKRFLQRCRSGPGRPITPQEIVHMAIQIGSGLAYLHRQNVTHRDVATRNCVVDDKLVVKVSDGALSRDLFPDDYHWTGEAQTRQVKWIPPESIIQPRYSSAADIWSFGVLLWELATLAQQPYLEIDHGDLFPFLKMGYRLSQPVNCPDELYSSMSRCWTWEPDDRPKWTSVIPELQSLHAQLAQYV